MGGSTTGNADQQALLHRQPPGHCDGLLTANLHMPSAQLAMSAAGSQPDEQYCQHADDQALAAGG